MKNYKEIEGFSQNGYIRTADILSIWKDIRIEDMNKLGDILLGDFAFRKIFKDILL